jgi:hypothetical protein
MCKNLVVGEKVDLAVATLVFIVHGLPAITTIIYRNLSLAGFIVLSADGGERKRQLLKIGVPIDFEMD